MAKRRCLLVGEGPGDIGRVNEPGNEEDYLGAVGTLLVRFLEADRGIPRAALDLDRLPIRSIRKFGGGLAGKVRGAMTLADIRGYGDLFVVVDRDREPARLKELRAGREDGRLNNIAIRTAVGCAVEALEAWLLGDGRSLANILDVPPAELPAHPEALDGRSGSGRHPKDILRRLLTDCPRGVPPGRLYCEIAEHLSLPELEKNCPQGFGALAEDIRAECCQEGG